MTLSEKKQLQLTACKVRMGIIESTYSAKCGHPGGSMSAADLFTYLYFKELNVNPANPKWEDRDRFVMSKGHCTVALYPTLALRGFFDLELLKTFRKADGHLSGHVEMKYVPGVDMSTGSLGQGFSTALGMALAGRVSGKDYYTYAVLGDGEIAEGQIWEACLYAGAHKLDHLIGIVDSNKVQLDGTTDEVMPLRDMAAKWRAFGYDVIEVADGNDMQQVLDALHTPACPGKPRLIHLHTTKGKGVSFMEGKSAWHGKAIDADSYADAMKELGGVQ